MNSTPYILFKYSASPSYNTGRLVGAYTMLHKYAAYTLSIRLVLLKHQVVRVRAQRVVTEVRDLQRPSHCTSNTMW